MPRQQSSGHATRRRPRATRRHVWVGVAVILAVVAVAVIVFVRAPSPSPIRLYRFLPGRDLVAHDLERYDWIIVKGAVSSRALPALRRTYARVRFVNYEQAAALNGREAAYARDRDWLALTCSGQEIHPASIPHVALMDITDPAARRWRARRVAEETATLDYDATYLDTLRAFYPVEYYDGVHCIDDLDAGWLKGSIELVRLVRRQTEKLVVGNGAGLQSGRNYSAHQEATDRLLAATEGVQIEHFFRNPRLHELDMELARRLVDQDKLVFIKWDGGDEDSTAPLEELPGVFLDLDD